MITKSDILKAHILIVDDQDANIALLEQMLQEAGYSSLVSTKNPHEVCALHRKNNYDLILLDLQMPGMDGFQVMEGLKEIETDSYLPVLAITAQPGHKLRALRAGAKDFISKPFDLGEVLIRVYNLLEVRLLHLSETSRNRERLENSQRIAGLGDWEYDFAHRLIWSDGVYQILGIARQDFPPNSESFYRQVHPEDIAFVHRQKEIAAANSHHASFEHRIIRPNGEIRFIHQITETIFDEQGRPSRESGTVQDITERKLADEALHQSEERYRLMFEGNPSPIWVFDSKTFEFLAVNHAAVALYGYSREEFLRLKALDIRPPEAIPDFLRRAGSAPTGFGPTGRSQHRKKDGTIFPVNVFAHAMDFAGRPARLVLAIDMTQSDHAAEALSASEARFRALSESAPLGIFECDAAGNVIYFNPAMTILTGRAASDAIGHPWKDNIHPEDWDGVSADWIRAAAEGNAIDLEPRLLRPDGSIRRVHALAAPSRDAEGHITAFIGTVEDITARRLAEVAIQESEERYRKLLMLSPDANFVHVDGLITLVNHAFCQLMGASDAAQLLGKPAIEVTHPDYHALIHERRRQHSEEHPLPPAEIKFVRLDGTTVEVEITSLAFDFRGRKEVQVIARDITTRKQAEAELREKTALLEAQMDSSIDGILVVDSKGKKILQNQRCIELWDIPHEIADETDDRQIQFVMNRTKNPQQFSEKILYLYTHPDETSRDELELQDDTVLDRYSAPIRGKDGRNYGRIWTFRDITASKAAEVALRESEERFKFVSRAVSDVVWDWDLATDHVWWSEGFIVTFGYSGTEIEPGVESWTTRIHPDERSRVVDSIHRAINTGMESWSAEYRFQRKDGNYAFVQDRGYILRDGNGRGIRMVGGMRDLTEQKKMEAQYLRAQRMDSIGTLAGGIAHDLNNVLAPIMMAIELLKSDLAADPRRSKILETIHISCRRGADLVHQVLSFARGLDGERVAIRLRHLIDDLDNIISETFPRNIRIVTEVADNLWPINGDPTQLHQVLLNLAVNARDAMPQGGKLTLAASNLTIDDQYAGTSNAAKAGTYVVIRVTDTGEGMPPEVKERIFEPFFTTKEHGKGTGIGLATVHTVVKSHGGFLQVESEVGQGTTFKVYLPADQALRTAATIPPFQAELPRGRDELILVIDDEFSIRHITQQTLETFGYRVITASDGAEAIVLYAKQAQQVALVLTDMMMPFMDGAAVIHVLVRLNPSVKIIAVSGLEVSENVSKANNAGAKDFLPKPYTAETLLQLVREVLDRPVSAAVVR